MLAWLVCEGDLPGAVSGHQLDALQAWVPLRGTRLFGVEPVGGVQGVEGLLRGAWSRLSFEADQASWQDKVVLVEVAGQIGLVLAVLLIGANGPWPVPVQPEVLRPRDGRTPGGGV